MQPFQSLMMSLPYSTNLKLMLKPRNWLDLRISGKSRRSWWAILDAPYEAEDLYNGETDDIWEKLDANDLIPILRNKFPKQIADFLARHNLKNNEGIGGTFAGTFIVPHFTFNNLILCILGPSIRKLLNEELLVDLHSSLQSLLVDDQAVALPVSLLYSIWLWPTATHDATLKYSKFTTDVVYKNPACRKAWN